MFVGHIARLSGGEIALVRLLSALKKDIEPHVILGEPGPLVEHLERMGVPVEVIPLAGDVRDVRRHGVSRAELNVRVIAQTFDYIWRLRQRLRELKPDIVHTNTLKAALYGGIAGRLAGIPVVWHIRDRIASDYLPLGPRVLIRTVGSIVPSSLIANSCSTLATIPLRLSVQRPYRAAVPDCVEPPTVRALFPKEVMTVGMVGRLAPWKGQHIFLRAFASVFRDQEAHARVIGSAMFGDDNYAVELPRLAERLGIDSQVDFRGFREDVWHELRELDVLVHASVVPEPFGQVVLEGMGVGLPVVATAAGGPAELIRHSIDGLLVPPGDIAALAKALRRLRDDPELGERLGAAALERSREFTPQHAAEGVLDVYRQVLGLDTRDANYQLRSV